MAVPPSPEACSVSNFAVPGPLGSIPMRLYQPAGNADGGFVSGGLDDTDLQAQYIARHSHVVVLSVTYSLAPAKPFPAAPEDATAAACAVCYRQYLPQTMQRLHPYAAPLEAIRMARCARIFRCLKKSSNSCVAASVWLRQAHPILPSNLLNEVHHDCQQKSP